MDLNECEVLYPIKEVTYLAELIDKGYSLKGPREDASKNLMRARIKKNKW
jgi:hypothetical protein